MANSPPIPASPIMGLTRVIPMNTYLVAVEKAEQYRWLLEFCKRVKFPVAQDEHGALLPVRFLHDIFSQHPALGEFWTSLFRDEPNDMIFLWQRVFAQADTKGIQYLILSCRPAPLDRWLED